MISGSVLALRWHRANGVAASAKSKKKVLERLEDDAVEKPTLRECTLQFKFPECSRLAPPVLPFDGVSFAYSGKKEDYLCEVVAAVAGTMGAKRRATLRARR